MAYRCPECGSTTVVRVDTPAQSVLECLVCGWTVTRVAVPPKLKS